MKRSFNKYFELFSLRKIIVVEEPSTDIVFVPTSCRDYSGDAVRLLAKYGADLNENRNRGESSPLDLAVNQKNENAVRSLIQAGCDVNVQVVGFTLTASVC